MYFFSVTWYPSNIAPLRDCLVAMVQSTPVDVTHTLASTGSSSDLAVHRGIKQEGHSLIQVHAILLCVVCY